MMSIEKKTIKTLRFDKTPSQALLNRFSTSLTKLNCGQLVVNRPIEYSHKSRLIS